MGEVPTQLPPGWDFKFDARTNRYYYINHFTKMTTWEDPRLRQRLFGASSTVSNQDIPMQHGSPEQFRRNYVYPSQTCPQPAFQMPAHYSPKSIPIQELNNLIPVNRTSSPNINRVSQLSQITSRMQEATLSTSATDIEQSVSKISTMFPTVSQTHIKLLFKKYYNREAVVISALQVEKHPITTPGPYTTPPPARNYNSSVHTPMQMTPPPGIRPYSRTGSPIARPGSGSSGGSPHIGDAYRNSPKPHSSPKMKLRYMKSIYPQVEETLLLEILANNDNNVQKTSEALQKMGFEKKENKAMIKSLKKEAVKVVEVKPKETPPPRIKTMEEKNKMKSALQLKYTDIPEQVITLALESVDYEEKRANHILEVMVKEEKDSKTSSESTPKKEESNIEESSTSETLKLSHSKSSLMTSSPSCHTLADKKDTGKMLRVREKKNSFRTIVEQPLKDENNYKSSYIIQSSGPNPMLAKGSDNTMLLEDYITWDGPDPNLRLGTKSSLAKGPNTSLLSKRTYRACGPNTDLCRGPSIGLAKGSIYSHLKSVVFGESRGK